MKKDYDERNHVKESSIKEGDIVLLEIPSPQRGTARKRNRLTKGSFRVATRKDDNTVDLVDADGQVFQAYVNQCRQSPGEEIVRRRRRDRPRKTGGGVVRNVN